MSDFTIKLNAELDLQNIKKQIENLDNASLELTKISVDTDKISKSITKAFNKSYTVKIDTSGITKQVQTAIQAGLKNMPVGTSPTCPTRATSPKSPTPKRQQPKWQYWTQNTFDNVLYPTNDALAKMRTYYTARAAEAQAAADKYVSGINNKIYEKSYSTQIALMKNKLGSYAPNTTEFNNTSSAINQLEQSYARLATAVRNYQQTSNDSNYRAVQNELLNMTSQMKLTDNEMKVLSATQDKLLSGSAKYALSNSFESYCKNNGKAVRAYRSEIEALRADLATINTEGDKSKFLSSFNALKNRAIVEGNTGASALEEIKRGGKAILQFAGTYGLYMQAFQVAQDAVQNVVKVDTAMTELRKVSDATGSQIDNYLQNATVHAKEYGAAVSDVVNATADWSRLGYSLPAAEELTKASLLYKNVGDNMTMDDVSENLISTLQGFQLDSSEAVSIIDKFNEVGKLIA